MRDATDGNSAARPSDAVETGPAHSASEAVEHPAHYTAGQHEAIEIIEAHALGFHTGNALKYVLRAGRKDPATYEQDIAKALWYLRRIHRDNRTSLRKLLAALLPVLSWRVPVPAALSDDIDAEKWLAGWALDDRCYWAAVAIMSERITAAISALEGPQ